MQWICVLVACVLFVGARTWNMAPLVFPEDRPHVQLLGNDSYFHVRHAEYSAKNFPDLLRVDPGAHFPRKQQQNVSGLFNILIAAGSYVVAPFSGERDPVAVSAAITPVVLGVGALILLFLLTRRLAGPGIALLAVSVHLLYPGTSMDRTALGFADQHAAEAFLVLGGVTGLTWLVQKMRNRPSWSGWTMVLGSVGAFLPFLLLFYSWLGAPLYIAVMAVGALLLLLGSVAVREVAPPSRALSAFFIGAAVVMVLINTAAPDLVMEIRKGIRWWNVGGLLFVGAGSWVYCRWAEQRLDSGMHPMVIIGATLAAVVVISILFFNVSDRGQFFWNQLTNERSGAVEEQGRVSVIEFTTLFGIAGWLAFLSLPLTLLHRDKTYPERIMAAGAGLMTTLIWLRTHDFDYVPPVLIAMLAGLSLHGLWALVRPRLQEALLRRVRLGSLLLLAVLLLAPMTFVRLPFISAGKASEGVVFQKAWFDAMDWMRLRTEEAPILPNSTVDPDTVYPEGSYGVMTAWDFGNFVAHRGKRPVVVSRYPSQRDAHWSTSLSEADADTVLCVPCTPNESVRYAVVTSEMASEFFSNRSRVRTDSGQVTIFGHWNVDGVRVPNASYGAPHDSALVTRLYRDSGSGLERYRLVYASDEQSLSFYQFDPADRVISLGSQRVGPRLSSDLAERIANAPVVRLRDTFVYNAYLEPSIKIFERVSGAVLTGEGLPGDTVHVQLALRDQLTSQLEVYRNRAVVKPDGRFAVRVPHHTERGDETSNWVATGPYGIRHAGTPGLLSEIQVSRQAVIRGDSLSTN